MEMKIPFYNLLNMFLTGFVFISCVILQYPNELRNFISSEMFTKLTAISETLLLLVVVAFAYEIGLILNRLSSVIFEPLLKYTKLIPFDNRFYIFQEKARAFPVMNILSREYAFSRTGIGEFVILSVLSAMRGKYKLTGIFICIAIIFLLSCRKQANKIICLMKE